MDIEITINELFDKDDNKISNSLMQEIIESFKEGILSLLNDDSFMVDGLKKIIIEDNYDILRKKYYYSYNILNLYAFSEKCQGCVIPIREHFYYILLSKDCLFSFYEDYANVGFTEKDILEIRKVVIHELCHIDDFNRFCRLRPKTIKIYDLKESLKCAMPENLWAEYYATRKSSEYVDLFLFSKELFEENSCVFSKVLGELELNLLFSLVGVREKVIIKENVKEELIVHLRNLGYILGDLNMKIDSKKLPNCSFKVNDSYTFDFYKLPIYQFLDDIFYTLDYNYQKKISDLSKLYNILSEYINCLWNFLESKD